MSLGEEKLLILKMLQEGKINSEEAAKLLEALENNPKQAEEQASARQQKQTNYQDEISKMKDRLHEWKRDLKNNYNQKDFDRTVEEFANKAEQLGKNVAHTTVGIVDKVMDFVGSFVDTNAFNLFGSYTTVEKTFGALAVPGMHLEVEGLNGYILVKKHLESNILIKAKIRSPQNNADEIVRFAENGNFVAVNVAKTGNISVSYEVFLPAVKFARIKLNTVNGKIYVEDSLSEMFECTTRNSPIELMGVNSDKISVTTKNARIQVGYVIGREIQINTNNSVIDIKHLKTSDLKAVTMNGRILVENAQNFDGAADMSMYLKTSNGGVKVNMNDMENRGYKVKAQTTNGGVNLLIPEMIYHNVNKQGIGGSFIEAESNGLTGYSQKVSIHVETNNGFVEIVK